MLPRGHGVARKWRKREKMGGNGVRERVRERESERESERVRVRVRESSTPVK